jgi:hypothetical protein
MLNKTVAIVILAIVMIAVGCKKDEGDGGNSSIKGYVHVTDYNSSFLIVQGDYPAADQDVYIIYGDDISYGDRIKTGPDGIFEFKYLREGDYTVYVYSEDTTLSGNSVVSKMVNINGKKKTIDAGTFEIKKN